MQLLLSFSGAFLVLHCLIYKVHSPLRQRTFILPHIKALVNYFFSSTTLIFWYAPYGPLVPPSQARTFILPFPKSFVNYFFSPTDPVFPSIAAELPVPPLRRPVNIPSPLLLVNSFLRVFSSFLIFPNLRVFFPLIRI